MVWWCQSTSLENKEFCYLPLRILLIKDESVLKNLVLQEAKKKESVRNAEAKITKLTEQLQAAEKILSVNRVFLKKLQEQVSSV